MPTSLEHSFVVTAYKESPYLAQCIRSLKAQSNPSPIIVTTSTPNDYIERVTKDEGVRLIVNEGATPGIASDWNFALAQAQTPLVTIAHQDDTYEEGYAQTALDAASKVDDLLIFFTNYGELRGDKVVDDNRLLRVKRRLLRPMERRGGASNDKATKRSILRLGSSICCPSVTFNLPLLPNPPFVSSMKSNLDWEAWERFSRLEGSFVYSSQILMHHRIHEGSETSALIKDSTRTKEDLAMLKKFWPSPIAHLLNVVYSKGQSSNG